MQFGETITTWHSSRRIMVTLIIIYILYYSNLCRSIKYSIVYFPDCIIPIFYCSLMSGVIYELVITTNSAAASIHAVDRVSVIRFMREIKLNYDRFTRILCNVNSIKIYNVQVDWVFLQFLSLCPRRVFQLEVPDADKKLSFSAVKIT